VKRQCSLCGSENVYQFPVEVGLVYGCNQCGRVWREEWVNLYVPERKIIAKIEAEKPEEEA